MHSSQVDLDYLGVSFVHEGTQFLECATVEQARKLASSSPETFCLAIRIEKAAAHPAICSTSPRDVRILAKKLGIETGNENSISILQIESEPAAHIHIANTGRLVLAVIQLHQWGNSAARSIRLGHLTESILAAFTFGISAQGIHVSAVFTSATEAIARIVSNSITTRSMEMTRIAQEALESESMQDVFGAYHQLLAGRFKFRAGIDCCSLIGDNATWATLHGCLLEATAQVEMLQARVQYLFWTKIDDDLKERDRTRLENRANEASAEKREANRDRELAKFAMALLLPGLWLAYWASKVAPELPPALGTLIVVTGVMLLTIIGKLFGNLLLRREGDNDGS